MPVRVKAKDDQYILNQCAKHLARDNTDPRHDYGHLDPGDPRARICEPWRFPVVDSHADPGEDPETAYAHNDVTFVYVMGEDQPARDVAVVGTFARLYEPIPLRRVATPDTAGSRYYSVTVVIPKGEVHRYQFVVDGQTVVDPINPQRVVLDNGREWSQLFTQLCAVPITFERWEWVLLDRLTDHILPFRTSEGRNFLARHYAVLDKETRQAQMVPAYRLDESVGVVNYIDKLLAKEERHHVVDYRICLRLVDRVLRQRNPYIEPNLVSRELYVDLYDQMAAGQVSGWDYQQYTSPRYFLQLLRRHAFTGAFSHPKYGGNAGAAAWAYLEERYRDDAGGTMFDWRRAIEPPLGKSTTYRG